MTKTAIITEITGEDGAYVAQLLLEKGYSVYGTYRRTASTNFSRIEELGLRDNANLHLVEYDLLEAYLRAFVRERGLIHGPIPARKNPADWFLAIAISFVLRREGLKYRARKWLYRHPKLEAYLRAFARERGLIHGPIPARKNPADSFLARAISSQQHFNDSAGNAHSPETLTPSARQIYANLKAVIAKNKQEAA